MLDVKRFNESASQLAITSVVTKAGLSYGASIEFRYQLSDKSVIVNALRDAEIPIHSSGSSSLTVKAEGLFQCTRITRALDVLKESNLISEPFVRQISEGFPNGHGGINPLNSSSRSRTTLESLVTDHVSSYLSRPIDDLGIPITDYSSLSEEERSIRISESRNSLNATHSFRYPGVWGSFSAEIIRPGPISNPSLSSSGINLLEFARTAASVIDQPIQDVAQARLLVDQFMGLYGLTGHSVSSSGSSSNRRERTDIPAGVTASQIGLYSQRTTTVSNEDKLKNIENVHIPEDYICPITLAIMTDPVYLDKDDTKAVFERSAIEKWLRDKGTHPYSRKNFLLSAIQPDIELKNSIDEFIEDKLNGSKLNAKL